jgi:hypothetical protein
LVDLFKENDEAIR